MNQEKIIFIVGVGRSGTSLLQSMLNAHSKIAFIPEIKYIRRFLLDNRLEKYYKKYGSQLLIEYLSRDVLLKRINFKINEFLHENNFSDPNLDMRLFDYIISQHLRKEKKDIFGYKDPRCIEEIEKLKILFPKAFVIHIIRDPRDILVSKRKADWSKNRSYYAHILINNMQINIAYSYSKRFERNFIEIYYEDLISIPEKTLVSICKKLNIEYEKDMMNFYSSSRKLVFEDEEQWKKETFGPIIHNNKNKWKNELNKWEITLIENAVKIPFSEYGYEKYNPDLRITRRFGIGIYKILCRFVTSIFMMKKKIETKRLCKYVSSASLIKT
jgi:hypothetical protein